MSKLSATIRQAFPTKRVIVIGDIVADQFLSGTIDRVSREAPVFILCHDETVTRPGGAANAAANIAAMGGTPILIGAAGADANGDLLRAALIDSGVDCKMILADPHLRTTTKIRVLAGHQYAARQQVLRIDYENRNAISPESIEKMCANIRLAGVRADAIIISDYNYGSANSEIFAAAKNTADTHRIPLIADSRYGLKNFAGAYSATPNLEEIEAILGKDFCDEDCSRLRDELGMESMLVTCGNKGMILFEAGKNPVRLPAVGSTLPVDVTGAGDTVIAAYSLGLASALSFGDAAVIANHAGGIVVMKRGTAVASADEIVGSLAEEEQSAKINTV